MQTLLSLKQRYIGKIIYICLFFSLVVSRFFIEGGENYDGRNSTVITYFGYLIEDFALAVASLVYLLGYFKMRSFSVAAILWLVLYFYVALSSPFSADIVLALHLSLRGIAYVFFGLLMYEYVKRTSAPYIYTKKLIHNLFFVLVLSSVVEMINVSNFEYVVDNGVGGSFYAIIGLISIYLRIEDLRLGPKNLSGLKSLIKQMGEIVIIVVSAFCVFKMNSLASLLCFATAYAIVIHKSIRIGHIVFFWLLVVLSLMYVLPALESGDIRIARKSLDTIMDGTGRFKTWRYCWDQLASFNVNPLGYGFMQDKVILTGAADLELVHSCHNSFLTISAGLGGFGLIYYVCFVLFSLLTLLTAGPNKKIRDLVWLFMLSLLAFGVASSLYPGMPTILISIFILLFCLRKWKYEENINISI